MGVTALTANDEYATACGPAPAGNAVNEFLKLGTTDCLWRREGFVFGDECGDVVRAVRTRRLHSNSSNSKRFIPDLKQALAHVPFEPLRAYRSALASTVSGATILSGAMYNDVPVIAPATMSAGSVAALGQRGATVETARREPRRHLVARFSGGRCREVL